MAMRDPPHVEGVGQERRAHIGLMLNRAIDEIEQVIAAIGKGDFSAVGELPRLKRDMVSAAKQLREAEIELNAQRHRDEGGVPGSEEPIDFRERRRALGSRLDQLRAAIGAGPVSEGA
ncbi:MAG: hypothetical protein AAF714_12255 [Pseudomonadota bacterium]